MRVTIDLEQGAEIFQNIGKLMRLREQQKGLLQEMAMSVIHHKAILSDDADPERTSSIIVLDREGLYVLRRALKLAADTSYRESLINHSDLGQKYRLTQKLGALAARTTTDNDWESFTVPIRILGEERMITLDTQHAKFMVQYLVPKMLGKTDYCYAAWYKNPKLKPWEERV